MHLLVNLRGHVLLQLGDPVEGPFPVRALFFLGRIEDAEDLPLDKATGMGIQRLGGRDQRVKLVIRQFSTEETRHSSKERVGKSPDCQHDLPEQWAIGMARS